MTTYNARTAADIRECIRGFDPGQSGASLRPIAGGTKSPRVDATNDARLDVSALAGMISYRPEECTFTAGAATTIAEVERVLAAHGHYLPFEPPFAPGGATLGGTVAAALSGPGRLRYGGVRDFLLGMRFVDGTGRELRGGSQVVKNAAGFSFHHLLLGSFGTLGVMTELTFKVFPHPQESTTLTLDHDSLDAAIGTLARLRGSQFAIDAAELIPPGRLVVRIAGSSRTIASRTARLLSWLQPASFTPRPLATADAQRFWQEARDLTWAGTSALIKVATTLSRLAELDRMLAPTDPPRRFGAGGDLAWIGWPDSLDALHTLLNGLGLPGVIVSGSDRPDRFLGSRGDRTVLEGITRVLDPRGVFSRRSA